MAQEHILSTHQNGYDVQGETDMDRFSKIEKNFNELFTKVTSLAEYDDNTAALAGGLTVGQFYRTGDAVKVVH